MENDQEYYYRRAELQLEMAQKAHHEQAVRAHYVIANHYLDRSYRTSADQDAASGR